MRAHYSACVCVCVRVPCIPIWRITYLLLHAIHYTVYTHRQMIVGRQYSRLAWAKSIVFVLIFIFVFGVSRRYVVYDQICIHVIAININTNANKCFTSPLVYILECRHRRFNEIESDQWVGFGIPESMSLIEYMRIHRNSKSLMHICCGDSCAYCVNALGEDWRCE